MSKAILKWLVVASLGFLMPLAALAQESSKQEVKGTSGTERESSRQEVKTTPAVSVYRLDYVIHELDNGKRINERKYSLSVQVGRGRKEWGHVRVGRRVPVATGQTSNNPNPMPAIQYMDVGVNLDCSLQEDDNTLLLETSVELSSVVTGGELAVPGAPVTRQAKTNLTSVLAPGKPTLIGSLDDVDSTHSYQIEVTATKLK